MNRWILGLVAISLVVTVAPTHALTVDDVIGLTRAEANDAIIMAKIEADGTVFLLTVNEILDLKAAGVSDAVITYMINTGKVTAAEEEYAEESGQDPEEEPYADEEYADDGYQTQEDLRYRGSIAVSFGSYYPQWPGYWYAYYYDPFYWPSLGFYWAYCPPFPYYRYSYSPLFWWDSWWCGYTYYHYSHHNHYDYHHYGTYTNYDGTHYARVLKDRNVGNRSSRGRGERFYKSPDGATTRPTRAGRAKRLRRPTPDTDRPVRADNRGRLRTPKNPDTPTRVTDSRRGRGRVSPTPTRQPSKRVQSPTRRGPRRVGSGPARVNRRSRPAPTPAPRVRAENNRIKEPPKTKETQKVKDSSGDPRRSVRSGKTRSTPKRSFKTSNRSSKRRSRSGKP